jgi:hypothetical protein
MLLPTPSGLFILPTVRPWRSSSTETKWNLWVSPKVRRRTPLRLMDASISFFKVPKYFWLQFHYIRLINHVDRHVSLKWSFFLDNKWIHAHIFKKQYFNKLPNSIAYGTQKFNAAITRVSNNPYPELNQSNWHIFTLFFVYVQSIDVCTSFSALSFIFLNNNNNITSVVSG